MILESLALSTADKTSLFYELVVDSEIQPDIRSWFDSMLITSELKPIKRIAELETITGLNDFADFEDEEREPNIPEQIKELSGRIEQPLNNSHNELKEVIPVIETTKDLKACAIVEYLKTEARPNDFGEFVIGKKELTVFMKNVVDEGLRVKSVSRQLKADLFERAVKLFPGIVYIKKSPSGNKTQMLALKESSKRTITHGLTRKAPLGILI